MKIPTAVFMILFSAGTAVAQMMNGDEAEEGCPMCGQGGYGMSSGVAEVPDALPRPENQEWLSRLREVLRLERHSRLQYQADEQRFGAPMPYNRIIPQESVHIARIEAMFKAYGLAAGPEAPPAQFSATLEEAYRRALALEQDLVPQYEWLIQNSPDPDTSRVLDDILRQTRTHAMMFSHALHMGGGSGPGPGMGGGMRNVE